MPSIEITDDQHERFAAVREELSAVHAGKYASVQSTDVMAYLLDLAETVDDSSIVTDSNVETVDRTSAQGGTKEGDKDQTATDTVGDEENEEKAEANENSDTPTGPGMLNILEDHDEKWHEADGDARYEVDLPDGSTETARTRDDVKVILFKHY